MIYNEVKVLCCFHPQIVRATQHISSGKKSEEQSTVCDRKLQKSSFTNIINCKKNNFRLDGGCVRI